MSKEVFVKDWGTGPIDLRDKDDVLELRPMEIHHKSDGAKNGGPSIAIVMKIPIDGKNPVVMGQISVAMLKEALGELGYVLVEPEHRVWRWWVGAEQLPKYVKFNPSLTVGTQKVFRLEEVREEAGRIWMKTDDRTIGNQGNIEAEYLLPATFDEYHQFMNAEAV